jgi:hypothetical protein
MEEPGITDCQGVCLESFPGAPASSQCGKRSDEKARIIAKHVSAKNMMRMRRIKSRDLS